MPKVLVHKLVIKTLPFLVIIAILCVSCVGHQSSTSKGNFNLIFKYGVGAKNVLDTFEGTYTKDMIMDPPITIKLSLSKEGLDGIYRKMTEIDFFNYPEFFSVPIEEDTATVTRRPYCTYYFKVEYNSKIKELWWEDKIISDDERAEKLGGLIEYIISIIESKEEYKKLPPPKGGYL